ncbi:MAG: UDP-N-acetylmuramoyl-tripeptide--D-alanyl-D-alanine ligase [bacterium]|nr:UDP-N-acetylmuramoyl-tripeptide--D-alanyl-D-alanine ligase [bacterium]
MNYNNEIGLCRTILAMPRRTEVLIVEMGMRGLGEIELLSQYAEPDISIITNIGTSHIGRLGSKENIAKAKCEIISHQKPNGILIAKADKLISDIVGDAIYYSFENAHITQRKSTKQKFEYQGYEYEIGVIGDHNVENAMAVIELGHYLNIDDELIAAGLVKFKPIRKRWEVEEINGIKIINDAYNANPDSMKASIKTSMDNYPSVLFVLGDMAELGENEVEYHKEIGEYLKEYNGRLLKVATVGKLSKEITNVLADTEIESVNFETKEGVAKYILDNASFGTTIVLKASRSMKLEDVVEEIRNAK